MREFNFELSRLFTYFSANTPLVSAVCSVASREVCNFKSRNFLENRKLLKTGQIAEKPFAINSWCDKFPWKSRQITEWSCWKTLWISCSEWNKLKFEERNYLWRKILNDTKFLIFVKEFDWLEIYFKTSETNVNLSFIVEQKWFSGTILSGWWTIRSVSMSLYICIYDRSGKFLSSSSNSAGKKD